MKVARRCVLLFLSGLRRVLPAVAGFAGVTSPGQALAQTPPASFTRKISTATQSLEVNFAYHPIRSSNFAVMVQQADGSWQTHASDSARTYLGTVPARPGAIAVGLLRADNTLWARISLEDGSTWTTTGGTAVSSSSPFVPEWPTTVVPTGGAGSVVYAAEVGIDSTFDHFTACGGTPAAVLEQCEFSVMSTNMVYLRDSAILHRIGKILIRADALQDPYAPDGGDTGDLLTRVRSLWNAGSPMGSSHDAALVLHSGANGGLAYVGVIGTSNRYSSNDSDSRGDFSVVWRHEIGHNWSANHYEGGGNPEGSTIMSNNALSRFSSSENRRIISHRAGKTSILDHLGAYPFPLPPRANQDTASFLRQTPVRVDVLANDSDSNGHVLSLHSFDSTSAKGGILTRSAATGPGGRDEVLYTPPPALSAGTDWFRYRVADSGGQEAVGYAMLRPRSQVLTLTDHWKLDETAGTAALNAVRSTRQGTHQNGVVPGQAGARPVTRRGAYYDGLNDRTSIPAPGYNTNVLTFTAWVRRSGTLNAGAAVVFTRAGSSVAGLHFGSANELRYTWNDAGSTFAPSPALTVPDETWCLAAMAVSPSGVTLHLHTPSGLQSATHATAISSEAFNGLMYFGQDTGSSTRCFRGRMDDVRVYAATLAPGDIASLHQQASQPPAVTLTQPPAGSLVSPLNVAFAATVGLPSGFTDRVDFVEDETAYAGSEAFPWQAGAAVLPPGLRSVTARASFGDWGYEVDSPPVSFTALPPPLPQVRVQASLPASKRGPVAGAFVLTRDHPIGSLTIPFTLGGTAVAGTDYEALTVSSVTFPDGVLTQTIVVNPIAAAPDAVSETVVLTPGTGSSWTVVSPAAATLAIDDHITSAATGWWNDAAVWNSGSPAPVAGTQNAGTGYSIAGHVVTSNNPSSNSQALVAGSLRVRSGGVLDLARLHDGTLVNASYNLPAVSVEDGGTVRFRCSNGSSSHAVAAELGFAGHTTLEITGGGYENFANLTGRISGNGTIAVVSASNAGGGTGFVRRISVNAANNPFSGNWTVTHPDSGDDFGGLRAGASNALGSGTVTVGTRSQLINDHATGLNSLAGVVLDGNEASLRLNQPWNRPAASLSMVGGNPLVQLGNAASSIGTLRGLAGTIQGSGASSALTVNQTTDALFSGDLGTNLSFTKSGPALLALEGTLHSTLRLSLTGGTLDMGTRQAAISTLTQSGGILAMDLPGASAPGLTLSGNFVSTGGSLKVKLPPQGVNFGVPYPLIAWQGTRSGQPAVEFSPPLPATVDYGTAANSLIRVTFYQPATLTVAASPPEGGSVSGGGTFPDGQVRPVTAVPAADWQFTGWTGSGIANPASAGTTVTLNGNQTVTAGFVSLHDLWAQGFGLSGSQAARGADPDGDGMVNAHERAFGFRPDDPNSALKLSIHMEPDGSPRLVINKVIPVGTFTLRWGRSPDGTWEGNIAIPITAEAADFPVLPPGPPERCFYRLVYEAPD